MEQRSPSFDSAVGSPRGDMTPHRVVVQNNHALISSASAAGKAKSMLPVVSTLIFGLAANLAPTTAQPMSFFFAVSAACSLYTTTYAVLEAYYIAMVTSGDVTARYLYLADEERGQKARDGLARKVDETLRAFEPYHRRSLDAMWGGRRLSLGRVLLRLRPAPTTGRWKPVGDVVQHTAPRCWGFLRTANRFDVPASVCATRRAVPDPRRPGRRGLV